MLEIERLSRKFNHFTAVEDISLSVSDGEVVGLLGHNGAGTSTLMKLLSGNLEASQGEIYFDGLPISKHLRQIQARIGYMPENCPVWSGLTVAELLYYHATLRNLQGSARKHAISRVVELLQLEQVITANVRTLSQGYRQRVGLARVILHQPDVFILDEPGNGLDPQQILHVRSIIRELAKHSTIIISTHILQEVEAVCDRVVILASGKKVVDAQLHELEHSDLWCMTVDADQQALEPLLKSISAISGLETKGATAGQYRYRFQATADFVPQLNQVLRNAGINLYELCKVRNRLESIFSSATKISG